MQTNTFFNNKNLKILHQAIFNHKKKQNVIIKQVNTTQKMCFHSQKRNALSTYELFRFGHDIISWFSTQNMLKKKKKCHNIFVRLGTFMKNL